MLPILISCLTFFNLMSQENRYFSHTVEKGQSLYSISIMYEVPQEEIISLNPGADAKIYVGQALRIPQRQGAGKQEIYHTIQPGETLYKLSTIYNLTAKEICDENPGLSAGNFKAGEVIRVPVNRIPEIKEEAAQEIQPALKSKCKEMHKVKRKETLFSVSRQYGISEKELTDANPELKDGMKRGQWLCIPYPKPEEEKKPGILPANQPSNDQLFYENRERDERIDIIKAAIILPFTLSGEQRSESQKMVEYYEGFLIAVDSLKRKGVSIDLHVFNSGDRKSSLHPILSRKEMKEMNIIFGPLYPEHIKPLATFAEENNILLVVPTARDNEVYNNPHIFQVNTPQSYLHSEVYEHFTRQFPNANVIIIDLKTEEKDKEEFINGLKQELQAKNIPVITITTDGNSIPTASIKAALDAGRHNIIIPTSGRDPSLIKLLPQLKLLKIGSKTTISLFGYPEWQMYTKDYLDSFFELDTYFYSSFYTNNLLPSAVNFTASYHKWYAKEMQNSHPKYGMLGYDTAWFFLHGLSRFGMRLEDNLGSMKPVAIQTGFKFERVSNWGGFINKKVFFVHFTNSYELIKLDFD